MVTRRKEQSVWRHALSWSVLALALGVILIALSGVGFWAQASVLSEDRFVDISREVLHRPETRDAIAREISNDLAAELPVARGAVQGPFETVVASLLDASFFEPAVDRAARNIWSAIFVEATPVTLDIESLRIYEYGVLTASSPNLASEFSAESLPTEVILLDEGDLPDLSPAKSTLIWASWIAVAVGLGIIAAVVLGHWGQAGKRYALLSWTGMLLIVTSLILLALSVPSRSALVLSIERETGRSIVGTTFDMLVVQLYAILLALILIGAGLAIGAYWKFKRGVRAPFGLNDYLSVTPSYAERSSILQGLNRYPTVLQARSCNVSSRTVPVPVRSCCGRMRSPPIRM